MSSSPRQRRWPVAPFLAAAGLTADELAELCDRPLAWVSTARRLGWLTGPAAEACRAAGIDPWDVWDAWPRPADADARGLDPARPGDAALLAVAGLVVEGVLPVDRVRRAAAVLGVPAGSLVAAVHQLQASARRDD